MHFPTGRRLLLFSRSSDLASPMNMNIPVKYTVSELFTGFPFCFSTSNHAATLMCVMNLHVQCWEPSSQGRKAWHVFRGIPSSLKFSPKTINSNEQYHTLLRSSLTGMCVIPGSATYHRLSNNQVGYIHFIKTSS